jgi:hypothetical protein
LTPALSVEQDPNYWIEIVPSVKVRDIIKILEQDGWQLARHGAVIDNFGIPGNRGL